MSLTTRCSSCATVFRVVQDQLRVSEGWVRCGRCGVPFNAIEGLVDAGDAPLRVLTPEAPAAPAVAAAPARRISDEEVTVRQPRPALQMPPPQHDDEDEIDAAAGVDIEIDTPAPPTVEPARAAPGPIAASA